MGKKGKIAPLMAFSSASSASSASYESEEEAGVGEERVEKERQDVGYVAVFTVCFDVDHGNTVSGVYPSVPHELLEGLEFRALPAGAHKGKLHSNTTHHHTLSPTSWRRKWKGRGGRDVFFVQY